MKRPSCAVSRYLVSSDLLQRYKVMPRWLYIIASFGDSVGRLAWGSMPQLLAQAQATVLYMALGLARSLLNYVIFGAPGGLLECLTMTALRKAEFFTYIGEKR